MAADLPETPFYKVKAQDIPKILRGMADTEIAEHSQRFFKTGKGEYGEGDKFLGIRVPVIRQQAKKYQDISVTEIQRLLKSRFHEERLCALLLLVGKFNNGSSADRERLYKLYVGNTRYINNWDLVDSSASYIVGAYLADKDKQPLYVLARSTALWERRIAIMATFHFIKLGQFDHGLRLSKVLVNDQQDLIHKAVGWMLREIGNRDWKAEEAFLKTLYKKMPRTMLRYAIEKFPERKQQRYLKGQV